MTLGDEDRRLLGLWAADCAERALPLFEAEAPSDTRPRKAVEGIRAFALGGERTGQLHSLAWAAHTAAREVGDPGATAAARAAAYASPAVREVVRRMPVRSAGRSRLDVLFHLLDAGLRR